MNITQTLVQTYGYNRPEAAFVVAYISVIVTQKLLQSLRKNVVMFAITVTKTVLWQREWCNYTNANYGTNAWDIPQNGPTCGFLTPLQREKYQIGSFKTFTIQSMRSDATLFLHYVYNAVTTWWCGRYLALWHKPILFESFAIKKKELWCS